MATRARRPDITQPFPPRLDDLDERAELTPSDVTDDALITSLDVAHAALEWHSAELIEFGTSRIRGGTLANSDWFKPSWYDLQITNADLANARLPESSVRRTHFDECRMTGFDVSRSVVQDVTFENCLANLANFRFATLTRVRFVGCQLRGVDLGGAKLTDVSFENCDLSEAQFHDLRTTRGRIVASPLMGAKSVAGLRGMTVDPVDIVDLAHQLAAELGIRIAD